MKHILRGLIVGCLLLGATELHAQTYYDEVINGAACTPYPTPGNYNNAFAYQHVLWAYGQSAFCHITMSSDWPVSNLYYVLFTGKVYSGTMNARICVHTGDTSEPTCGTWGSLTPDYSVNWVTPPYPLPTGAAGSFVELRFPPGGWSKLAEVIPVWQK